MIVVQQVFGPAAALDDSPQTATSSVWINTRLDQMRIGAAVEAAHAILCVGKRGGEWATRRFAIERVRSESAYVRSKPEPSGRTISVSTTSGWSRARRRARHRSSPLRGRGTPPVRAAATSMAVTSRSSTCRTTGWRTCSAIVFVVSASVRNHAQRIIDTEWLGCRPGSADEAPRTAARSAVSRPAAGSENPHATARMWRSKATANGAPPPISVSKLTTAGAPPVRSRRAPRRRCWPQVPLLSC